jgi:hypothetical protein
MGNFLARLENVNFSRKIVLRWVSLLAVVKFCYL